MSAEIAAVVVTYNSAREIGRCLRAIDSFDLPRGSVEVFVVDNASTDGTRRIAAETLPSAHLIWNPANRGFAGAVNQAIRASSAPFLLLLNPDAYLLTPLAGMVREFDDPDVAAVGGKLVDEAGQPQVGFNVRSFPTATALAFELLLLNRLWPNNSVNRRYRQLDFDASQAQEVEQPAGAFLMLRRAALDRVGLLDEGFFPLWFEDVDLCLRLVHQGCKIRYVPSAVAKHAGGHSLRAMATEGRYLAWYGNLLRFSNKHLSGLSSYCLRPLLLAGVFLRWLVSLVTASRAGERKAYLSTMKVLVGGRVVGGANVDLQTTSSFGSKLS